MRGLLVMEILRTCFTILVFLFSAISSSSAAGDFRGPIEVNPPGFERAKAKVYFPTQYESQERWPLVVLLHGFTGTASKTDMYMLLRYRTSSRGFILVTPDGTANPPGSISPKGEDYSGKQFWNATEFCCDFLKSGVDDVKYLTKLVDYLSSNYRVDRRRVYLLGHSNGGFMANRLACEEGEKFAAIASLAGGSFKNLSSCKKSTAVAYLQIHAVNDGTIAYGEDARYAGGLPTVQQWLKKNDCSSEFQVVPRKSILPLVVGPEMSMQTWRKCSTGKEVALWTIQNYSGPFYVPHIPSLSWSFSEEVLDFLLAHSLQ
jgi:polyhydroxybutyrate depolymerase